MVTINKNYLALTFLLFVIEILIALYIHDDFIRPYLGDVLVVILIYCFVKSFFKIPVFNAAVAVLVFSYFIEMLQYFNFVTKLGLEKNKIAKIVLGSSFEWLDIIAYTVGFFILLLLEKRKFIFKEIS
ncbi:DUF2809 domain-containing protein [Flavobacterium enshiense]|uniref:ribosomal maturation YjgA family protein n=1 Tax=Flavobacterium enshiense TaxID=1341165 RepID=UPI00345D96E8